MDHVDIDEVVTAQTAVARMRQDQKPFDDPKVRKAFRLATDSAKVLEIAHKNVGQVAEHHHVCPMHPDYMKLPEMARDVEEAKKLLAEAGFPDGLEIEINCKPDPIWEQAAVETMVEQWKDAGINAKINVMPSAKFWEVWDKVPFGFTEWTHRPLGFMVLALAYRTGVPWNESAYSNKQFDELLTKAEGTLDVKARSRSSASSRRSCRRTDRSRSRCGGRSSSRSTRSSRASPPIPPAISSARNGASNPDRSVEIGDHAGAGSARPLFSAPRRLAAGALAGGALAAKLITGSIDARCSRDR